MATNPSQGNLPLIRIENTGAAQTNVPFTFGQVFKVGHLKPRQGLGARMPNGEVIALQVNEKATHADGSVRHAIISGILPTLFAKEERELMLIPATAGIETAKKKMARPASGSIELLIDSVKYAASIDSPPQGVMQWLSGPVVDEWSVGLPLLDAKGAAHAHLAVRAGLRAYSDGHARIEIIIENTKTFAPGARNYTYDVEVKFGGKTVFEQKALTHYHHARWRKVFWLGDEPQIHIKHDIDYLIDTRAVPNYDRTTGVGEAQLASYAKNLKPEFQNLMAIGALNKSMGTTGGRPDIGPLPAWTVMYLLTMDKRARASMMAIADGAASWSIHYRDEETGYPVRTDNEKNKNISTHMNLAKKGPLPVPRFSTEKGASSATPYSHDTAHQPSMVYVPYLLTGEYYYLEELHFWAASNSLETDPGNSGYGKGLIAWQQVRGQAWSLRTLGHAAYITPDDHPMKGYFVKQLDNNLRYYHDVFVAANPNSLGAHDGSGPGMERKEESAPWQDDFFTWALGYLAELGFEKAKPILQWKAKYVIGRMTDPGYCWIQAATYYLKIRDSASGPVYDSFDKVYRVNFDRDAIWLEAKTVGHPKGLKYIDQPCGSQAQANWLGAAYGKTWPLGQMVGHASSATGYPANMQPALAVVASLGIHNAKEAWERFDARTTKPDYRTGPQWAIVPRKVEQVQSEEPVSGIRTAQVFSVEAKEDGRLQLVSDGIVAGEKYTVVFMSEAD